MLETAFTVPERFFATSPPERRGIARDQVRLLVLERDSDRIYHTVFHQIGKFLNSGDVLVFNNSRTLPAVLVGVDADDGSPIEIRLTEHLSDDSWYALLMSDKSVTNLIFGEQIRAEVLELHPRIAHVWKIRFSLRGSELLSRLYQLGQPVRYEYVERPWELRYYQTVYALQPGSAEMPSAGRAFTWKMLFELKKSGIEIASITLHTGLSYFWQEALRPEFSEEEFFVTESAAKKINQAISEKRRIIAIGTSVARALESAASQKGLQKCHGYTRLKITADTRLQIVDGLLTGFHEPEASHLDLLSAFLPIRKIQKEYQQALAAGYLWHEFGDLNLIL